MKQDWTRAVIGALMGALVGCAATLYQLNARVIRLETQMETVSGLPLQLQNLERSISALNANIDLLRSRINRVDPDGR